MRIWLAAVAGLMVLVSAGSVAAQTDVRDADADMFAANVEYDPAVPTPEEFLGVKLRLFMNAVFFSRIVEAPDDD